MLWGGGLNGKNFWSGSTLHLATIFKLETSYYQQSCQQYSTVQEGFSFNNSTTVIPAQLEKISLFPMLSMTCWYLHLPENGTKVKH